MALKERFVPRNYQMELLDKAMEGNTIVCLKTGAGKTLVAIMLIKELQHEIIGNYEDCAKRTFFLVPKVPLVLQQAKAIKDHTCLKVGAYYGAMGVDLWHSDKWNLEFKKHNVMVMTAQILLNLLDHGYIKLSEINLLIFDECHSATGSSPYCNIMNRYKDYTPRPRILGLTASIINGKCKPSQVDNIMTKLEEALYCRINTASNMASVYCYATKPREVIIACAASPEYNFKILVDDALRCANEAVKLMQPIMFQEEERKRRESGAEASNGKNNISFANLIRPMHQWADEDDFVDGNSVDLGASANDILKWFFSVLRSLGPYCSKILADNFLRDIPKLRQEAQENFNHADVQLYDIVENTLTTIVQKFNAHFARVGEEIAIRHFISPKLERLMELVVELLERCNPEMGNEEVVDATRPGTFRAIVFVEQRVVAWILSEFLNHVADTLGSGFGRLHTCYVVGHGVNLRFLKRSNMNVKKQTDSLMNFSSGVCNVLVATKVVEEGLDIPKCNLVVRYDQPKDFCSYVQSMGRARAERALYALLVDQELLEPLKEDLTTFKMIECILNIRSQERPLLLDDEADNHYENFMQLPNYYPTDKSGASLTPNSAIQLLYWYCSFLPGDRFSKQRPHFKYEINEFKLVRCLIKLPVNSMHHQLIEGDLMPNHKSAKKAASYRTCIMLHEKGELNDHLIPSIAYLDNYMIMLGVVPNKEGETAGAAYSASGTRKRKRIYRKAVAPELHGGLPIAESDSFLHAITFEGKDGEERCCYGLLSSKLIPAVAPFTVYEKRRLTIRIRRPDLPSICLDQKRIDQLEAFHCAIFADILYIASKVMVYVGAAADTSFLLVPLDSRAFGLDSAIGIDWETVTNFAKYKSGMTISHNSNADVWQDEMPGLDKTSSRYGNLIRGALVVPLHRTNISRIGRFEVLDLCKDMSPLSPFPSNTFTSYSDYFYSKYGASVTDPNQPLICVDYAPNALNLLLPSLPVSEKRFSRRDQHLIPELCHVLPLDIEMYRQALAIPSILHRLNGMLLARRLMDRVLEEADLLPPIKITCSNPLPPLEAGVSACPVTDDVIFSAGGLQKDTDIAHLSSLFFQAMTSRSAGNWDDMERLEVIGDSFLKYATSVHLFCQYSDLNEGVLSLLRTGVVKNHNLFYHGVARDLPARLNVTTFVPRTMWLPPGFRVPDELGHSLVEADVPFYLWPFAKPCDIGKFTESYIWIARLKVRWSRVDSSHRDNSCNPSLSATVTTAHLDSDEEDEGGQINFKHNPFEESLISDKTVADSVEAITGAVLVSGGQRAAIKFLVWLGLKIVPQDIPLDVPNPDTSFWRAPKTALLSTHVQEADLAVLYSSLEVFEKQLGYTFKEKSFLYQAVIHSSYTRHPVTNNYQRLEFLGDAVLDFLVTMHLYKKCPDLSPGDLTDLRSSLVDNGTFAYLAVKHNFHKHMKYCSAELFRAIDRYLTYHCQLSHPKDMIYMMKEDETLKFEDIQVPKALGDLFESLAGAIYLDSGLSLKAVWNIFYPIMADVIDRYSKVLPINPVRIVMEKFTGTRFSHPLKEEHAYSVAVTVNQKTYNGLGKTKDLARQAAAKCALKALQILPTRGIN